MRSIKTIKTLIENSKILNSKIKLLWLKSYLAIIVVLIFVGIFSLGFAKNILNNENEIYCNAIIESEKKRTDEKITIAVNMAAKIAKDEDVRRFASKDNSYSMAYDAYELQNKLNSYFLFEDSMSEAYVVFDKNDYVVGTMYTGNLSSFRKSMEYKYSEDIGKVFESDAYGIDLFDEGIVYKLPIIENTKEVAKIYIFLDVSYILNEKSQDIMNIFVSNNRGDVSSLRRSQKKNEERIEQIKDIADTDNIVFLNDSVMLKTESDVGNVYYIFEMLKSRYKQGENLVTVVMCIFFILCIGIGVYFSIKMIEKNYYPIQQLLKKMHVNTDVNEHEFEIINNAINELINQNHKMFKTDKEKTEDLKNSYFTGLLKTKNVTSEQVLNDGQLKKFGVDFPYDYFVVSMCYLEDISYYKLSRDGKETNSDYSLCNYVVSNVANDIFADIDNWVSCEVDGVVTFIFNIKENRINDFLVDKLITLENILSSGINIETFMSVSDVHKGFEGYYVAYDEIKFCKKKQKEYSDNILFYNELMEIQKHKAQEDATEYYYFPPEQEKRIMECVRGGQEKEMRDTIEDIIDANLKNTSYSLYKMKYLGYDLACMVAKNLNANYSKKIMEKLEIQDVFLEIERCGTFEEVKDKIIEIMSCICNENSGVPIENRSTKICKMVKEYIEKNYSNPNLSLVYIASEFNLNDTYLSSTYKKYYSIGLTDYLRIVRIEKAKELLKENVLTVDQISEMVGYNSARAFSRAFKTVTGVTPKVFATNQK